MRKTRCIYAIFSFLGHDTYSMSNGMVPWTEQYHAFIHSQ